MFLLQAGTHRYRGNLCFYSTCPKGKPECEVAGCGAQPFLQLYEDFKFDRSCLFAEHNIVLFERTPDLPPAAAGSNPPASESAGGEVPF